MSTFQKSISTKPKNDQGKSYNDRTDRKKDRLTDRQIDDYIPKRNHF